MKKKWLWILVFVYIGFIFSNSLQVGESSSSFSSEIAQMIMDLFHISLDFDLFHHFIRKLAHFSEYFILGILVNCADHMSCLWKNKKQDLLFFGILPPVIDETIQYFVPGRNGAFTDVMIDMSGFYCASLLFYLIFKKHQ